MQRWCSPSTSNSPVGRPVCGVCVPWGVPLWGPRPLLSPTRFVRGWNGSFTSARWGRREEPLPIRGRRRELRESAAGRQKECGAAGRCQGGWLGLTGWVGRPRRRGHNPYELKQLPGQPWGRGPPRARPEGTSRLMGGGHRAYAGRSRAVSRKGEIRGGRSPGGRCLWRVLVSYGKPWHQSPPRSSKGSVDRWGPAATSV